VTYTVRLTRGALDQMGQLPAHARKLVRERIGRLASNQRPPGVRKVNAPGNVWRIRAGDYRVIYAIRDSELLVLVVRVGDRKHVYDRLERLAAELAARQPGDTGLPPDPD
jgi:mRNA interferase RelE/StbE